MQEDLHHLQLLGDISERLVQEMDKGLEYDVSIDVDDDLEPESY